jgi:hypothetical protein
LQWLVSSILTLGGAGNTVFLYCSGISVTESILFEIVSMFLGSPVVAEEERLFLNGMIDFTVLQLDRVRSPKPAFGEEAKMVTRDVANVFFVTHFVPLFS